MKQKLIIFLLFFFAISTYGQRNNILQFELGLGLNRINDEHAQGISLSGTFQYKFKSIILSAGGTYGLRTLGIDSPRAFNRRQRFSSLPEIKYVSLPDNRFNKLTIVQLGLDYIPNFENFRPIIGFGFGKSFITNKVTFLNENFEEKENPGVKALSFTEAWSYYIKAGYNVKNIRFNLFVYMPFVKKESESLAYPRIISTSIGYSFGLINRESIPKFTLTFRKKTDLKPLRFRVEIGSALAVPIFKDQATSIRLSAGLQIFIPKNKSLLLFSYEQKGSSFGKDKKTAEVVSSVIAEEFTLITTSISRNISVAKIAYAKMKEYTRNVDLFYGGGVGYYEMNRGEKKGIYVETLGPFITIGLRTGMFTSRLDVNIPLSDGKIPLYIGFQTAFGINFRWLTAKQRRADLY